MSLSSISKEAHDSNPVALIISFMFSLLKIFTSKIYYSFKHLNKCDGQVSSMNNKLTGQWTRIHPNIHSKLKTNNSNYCY